MMAICWSNAPSTLGITFSGTNRVAASRSCWAMKRFTSSMATAWSTVPRVQASSQRRLQMRPHTAGKGFSRLISCRASRYLPWAASFR